MATISSLRSYFENVNINREGKNKIGFRGHVYNIPWNVPFEIYTEDKIYSLSSLGTPESKNIFSPEIFDKITIETYLQGGMYIYIFEIKIYLRLEAINSFS